MTKTSIILLLALTSPMAISQQMYEWRDPTTGRLQAGDRPPADVPYWREGSRTPGQATGITAEQERAVVHQLRAERCPGDDPEIGGVAIGMKQDDVAWCYDWVYVPDPRYQNPTINTTRTAHGQREQWVYRHISGKTRYFYFDNGILTAIQK